jgi:hypothetical protein
MEWGEKLSAVLLGALVLVLVSAGGLAATTEATFNESLRTMAWSALCILAAGLIISAHPEYWLPVASAALGLIWWGWGPLMDVFVLWRVPGGGRDFFLRSPPAWLFYVKWGGVVVPFCIGIASGVRAYSRRW